MEKILVIEDNPVNLELFIDMLTLAGYSCCYSSDGNEAIEIALRQLPTLILLDIQLPGKDGITILKELRQIPALKDTKIIALTAYAMAGDKENLISQGFDGYISKPVKMDEFLKAIKGYLP